MPPPPPLYRHNRIDMRRSSRYRSDVSKRFRLEDVMPLTPQQMDAKMNEHFAFESTDDVEGVLATLTDNAEHDIVGWPLGPTHGRDAARRFYETMFVDLADSKVETVKRLYGNNFMVDE